MVFTMIKTSQVSVLITYCGQRSRKNEIMALIDIEEILLGPVSIPNFKRNLSNSCAVVIAFLEV